MWRGVRIGVLLLVLVTVAQAAWLKGRDLAWKDTLYVAVYPVNADGSARTTAYLRTLKQSDFEPVTRYFEEEAARIGLPLQRPFEFYLGPEITEHPPALPSAVNGLEVMWWSLRLSWWSWRHQPTVAMPPRIWLYLMYHDPQVTPRLAHSTALDKGRVGLVNVFADGGMAGPNLVILAHELLHTVGATDKYAPGTNLPAFPQGFAEPARDPLYPQEYAELMAGRIPVSERQADIPESLADTLIGDLTADEIHWTGTQ